MWSHFATKQICKQQDLLKWQMGALKKWPLSYGNIIHATSCVCTMKNDWRTMVTMILHAKFLNFTSITSAQRRSWNNSGNSQWQIVLSSQHCTWDKSNVPVKLSTSTHVPDSLVAITLYHLNSNVDISLHLPLCSGLTSCAMLIATFTTFAALLLSHWLCKVSTEWTDAFTNYVQ